MNPHLGPGSFSLTERSRQPSRQGELMSKRSKGHPKVIWAWWKVLSLAILVFGVFGALPGFLPPVSISAMRLGWALAIPAALAALWSWWNFSWWARLAGAALWSLQILVTGARAWTLLIGITWIWLVPIVSAYLLAWAMPAMQPLVSETLWGEQWTPQTRWGKTILGLTLAIGPSAGVLGAAFGMFGIRSGEQNSLILIAAVLFSAVAIQFAFAFAYQFWPERPWSKQAGSS